MKRYTAVKFIRLSDEMKWQCELAATKAKCSFGEWARGAFQDKLQSTIKPRRAK